MVVEDRRETKVTLKAGDLKMLRETLCVAQHAVANYRAKHLNKGRHMNKLQKLIDQIDVMRPLGPDGKHGDRHTPFCGCQDVEPGDIQTDGVNR